MLLFVVRLAVVLIALLACFPALLCCPVRFAIHHAQRVHGVAAFSPQLYQPNLTLTLT